MLNATSCGSDHQVGMSCGRVGRSWRRELLEELAAGSPSCRTGSASVLARVAAVPFPVWDRDVLDVVEVRVRCLRQIEYLVQEGGIKVLGELLKQSSMVMMALEGLERILQAS